MKRPLSLSFALVVVALPAVSGCLDVGSDPFADPFAVDDSLFADDDVALGQVVQVEDSRIRGDIGPAKNIDSPGTSADVYADSSGYLDATVVGEDKDGNDVMSIISINQIDLEPGCVGDTVIVNGCANPDDEGSYAYDAGTDNASAVVVGTDDEDVIDIVITADIAGDDGRAERHVTTLRVNKNVDAAADDVPDDG
jgi:hypothetical protein